MQILNNSDEHLLTLLTEQLEGFGLHAGRSSGDQTADLTLELSRGDSHQAYALHLTRKATLAAVSSAPSRSPTEARVLVGAPRVSPRSAEVFRRAGIQYVDAAGNAWIQFGDVLVDVQGRRAVGKVTPEPGSAGGHLFSAARAQVVFALLQWPQLWEATQREVAEAAGVSLGQANSSLSLLREAGFGPGGHRTPSELLDLWAAAFPSGLARKLVLAHYNGPVDRLAEVDAETPVCLGGADVSGEAAAADFVRPTTLTIYVEHLDPQLAVKNRWRSDGTANITVRRKFWRTPTGEPDYEAPLTGLREAPDVLVYADLAASEDARIRSAARDWRQRRLARLHPTS